MSISLTGPTAAFTSTSGLLTAVTLTFVADQSNNLQTKAYALSAIGGTATGATIHSVAAPKQVFFKRPASYAVMSGYNQVSGLYSRVPKNVHRVMSKGSCKVGATQWETIPCSTQIGVPAGSSYDAVNLELSIAMHILALFNQLANIIKAAQDGLY